MKVSISQIRPNPFQVRKHIDPERVKALAEEIKALGYWGGLRARKRGNYYEICFGHRRLDALKLLKVKEVDLDVVDLSDEDMATQALVENLQRENLDDVDKARGIKQLIQRFEADGKKNIHQHIATLMGFKSERRVYELLSVIDLTKDSQRLITNRQIAGTVAIRAKQIGGEEMIATAAKHELPLQTLVKIQRELNAIEEPKIREKVTKAVVAGRLRDPESVRQRERQLRAEESGPLATDLRVVIRKWTKTMEGWTEQLEEAAEFLDYIEGDPEGAAKFKAAARTLIDGLKRFL